MRLAIRRNLACQTREMVIRTGKRETIDLAAKRGLDKCEDRVFITPEVVEMGHGRSGELHYDLGECVSLREFLRKGTMNEPWLVNALVDVAQALVRMPKTDSGRFPTVFDLRYVFVDTDARLHLVYVPVRGLTPQAHGTPLQFLMRLAKHEGPRHVYPSDRMLRESLRVYVENERGTFSLNRFRSFIKGATGIEVMANGTVRGRPCVARDEYVLRDLTSGNTFGMKEGLPVRLGRGDACDIQLVGRPHISRDHASVCIEGDGVTLVDLGSTNGTYVKGRGLLPSLGMRIPIGQVFFLSKDRFRVEKRWEEVCCE